MSLTRTLRNRIPVQIALAVAGSAVAVTAVVSGTAGASSAAGEAAAAAHAVSVTAQPAAPPLLTTASGGSMTLTVYAATRRHRRTPREIARRMMKHRFGWGWRQFRYLNKLWERESGWNKYANNPYSGAYGIPQAVPGSKMATAGPNWQSDAHTQILWGLRYIKGRYRNPYQAWEHELSYGWY